MNGMHRHRQGGAAAIEFAFVFPLLLFVIYGTIVYGYVFFLQQTINLLAQEGAKAAVAVSSVDASGVALSQAAYSSNIEATVQNYLDTSLVKGVLPLAQQNEVTLTPVPVLTLQNDGSYVATITVQFGGLKELFPQIGLPGIGASLPPLPTVLTASATVRVS